MIDDKSRLCLIKVNGLHGTPISLRAMWARQTGKYSGAKHPEAALIRAGIAQLFGPNTCQIGLIGGKSVWHVLIHSLRAVVQFFLTP